MTNRRLRQLIRESNLIEGISDPKEIDQSIVAWRYLEDHNMSLTHGCVCKVQKIITLHQNDLRPDQRGYYRSQSHVDVRVGDYLAPSHTAVERYMDQWLKDYERVGPWPAHVGFEKVHPFVDGNGRTGRMLMWWQEVKSGQEPTLIKAKDRQEYYAKLSRGRNYVR